MTDELSHYEQKLRLYIAGSFVIQFFNQVPQQLQNVTLGAFEKILNIFTQGTQTDIEGMQILAYYIGAIFESKVSSQLDDASFRHFADRWERFTTELQLMGQQDPSLFLACISSGVTRAVSDFNRDLRTQPDRLVKIMRPFLDLSFVQTIKQAYERHMQRSNIERGIIGELQANARRVEFNVIELQTFLDRLETTISIIRSAQEGYIDSNQANQIEKKILEIKERILTDLKPKS